MSAEETLRLDKWLWHARFFKTRSLSAKVIASGAVRVNGTRVSKPASPVRKGDGLTFPKEDQIRIVRVLELGTRRGPAPEAQALYEDLTPPPPPKTPYVASPKFDGKGRPTKKDRRAIDASKPMSS